VKKKGASGRENLRHVSADGFTKPGVSLQACSEQRVTQVIRSHNSKCYTKVMINFFIYQLRTREIVGSNLSSEFDQNLNVYTRSR